MVSHVNNVDEWIWMSEIFFHRNDNENRKNISWSSGLYGTHKKQFWLVRGLAMTKTFNTKQNSGRRQCHAQILSHMWTDTWTYFIVCVDRYMYKFLSLVWKDTCTHFYHMCGRIYILKCHFLSSPTLILVHFSINRKSHNTFLK